MAVGRSATEHAPWSQGRLKRRRCMMESARFTLLFHLWNISSSPTCLLQVAASTSSPDYPGIVFPNQASRSVGLCSLGVGLDSGSWRRPPVIWVWMGPKR